MELINTRDAFTRVCVLPNPYDSQQCDYTHAFHTTFNVMFDTFKQFILVQLRKGRIATFLVVDNANFLNEWGYTVEHPIEQLKRAAEASGTEWNAAHVHSDPMYWSGHGAIHTWSTSRDRIPAPVTTLFQAFSTTCAHEEIPDMDVFVNWAYAPLVRHDGSESFHSIFGAGRPLSSYRTRDTMLPVVSMCTTEQHWVWIWA
jgi:hypothetical protein